MEQIAALRGEWFAQLAEAIDGAQHLAWQLGKHDRTSAQARELYGRLEAARQELDALRGIQVGGCAIDPDWLEKLGLDAGPDRRS